MLEKRLSTATLEDVYDLIAEGIDRAGEAKAKLFLAKLSLALANLIGDAREVRRAVESALRDL
ncbi:MAG TPA: hypothetical protein VK437_15450 [Steroidobacteraceae bacterium]|nr:hypothetical protein [Steroidobacteraceae bacterium]